MKAFWIALRDMEARPPLFPPGYLMAIFVGYGDESGKQDDSESTSSAYGILVGANECWDAFDESWDESLRRAGIEYFHRKEFGKPNGPYAHLDKVSERQLFEDLVKAIQGSGLEAYATAVRHAALVQFKLRTGILLDAYALSLYTCLCYIWSKHQQDEITLYLDWVENRPAKQARLHDYIITDQNIPELSSWFDTLRINNASKPKPSDRLGKVPGYQAADFLAWETRKYVHTNPNDEQHLKNDGLVRPMKWPPVRRRKSLHALNEAAEIMGTFWDVEVLESEHMVRRGIWKPASSHESL
jgi:hypothetical protein